MVYGAQDERRKHEVGRRSELSSFNGRMADHLRTRLVHAGLTAPIFVLSEAEYLPMGGQFGSQLPDAISRSKISIPIFRELVQMVENRKSTGSFWEAFHSHKMWFEQRDVEAGQQALRDVSFLKGWESEKMANGHQGEFVGIVVEMVLSELRQVFLVDVPETLVGIDDHMKKIIRLLASTRIIGIDGMGGIGKTTLTCAEFVNCSLLPDIQEIAKHSSR